MNGRKRVEVDQHVPIRLTLHDRAAILDHTMAGPGLTAHLMVAELYGRNLHVGFTLSEIEELYGYIAAEANHTPDAKLERRLDRLYGKLRAYEDIYEDEFSAPRDCGDFSRNVAAPNQRRRSVSLRRPCGAGRSGALRTSNACRSSNPVYEPLGARLIS